jgi:tetratricopeptide (TPR) repeat protein
VGTVARLKGGQHRPYLVAGGVGVVVLAAVGVVLFGVGGKKQAGSEQKPAPVRAVVGSDKAAAPAQPATVEKPALSAAAVEPAKPQPAVVEKFEAPAAERSRPAEKKVAAEKPAPAERPVSAKPVASPKPAVEKPVAAKAPSEPAPPPPEKKQVEAAAPAAQPATNRTQEAAEAYQRGNAKLLNGALPEAIAAFSEALKLNPKDAQSQRGLGMAYAQSGNATQAVRHFKLYLKASPSAPDRALIEKRIDQLGGR